MDPSYSLKPFREDVENRLRTHPLLVRAKGFVGGITDGELAPTDDFGRLVPHWVLTFTPRTKANISERGIADSKDDLQLLNFGLEAYAEMKDLDDFIDRIWEALQGYSPINSGPLDQWLTGTVRSPFTVNSGHPRAGQGMIFRSRVGTISAGMPVA